MKRKIISLFLAIVLIIPCLFMLNSCGKSKPKEPEINPSEYTLADIQKVLADETSKGMDSILFGSDDYKQEAVSKLINGKKVIAVLDNIDKSKYFFIRELKLYVYKDENGNYYYAKQLLVADPDDKEGSVHFSSFSTGGINNGLIKNADDFNSLTDFETYLCYDKGEWYHASTISDAEYKKGNKLTTAQKNWFLTSNSENGKRQVKNDLTCDSVYTNGTEEYYKITYKHSWASSSKEVFFTCKSQSSGYYDRIATISYEKSDVEIDKILVDLLNKSNSEKVQGFENFYYYDISVDVNTDKIKVKASSEDNPDYYLCDDFNKKIENQMISKYGSINPDSYEGVTCSYLIEDNGKYYLLNVVLNLNSGTPSLFDSSLGECLEKTKVELSKQEYEAYSLEVQNLLNLSSTDIIQELLNANQKDIDKINSLYGEGAYKFSFRMAENATKENYTAIIEKTILLEEYEYNRVYINSEARSHIINNPLVNQKVEINFSNQKLTSINVFWKLEDNFLLTNQDTENEYSTDYTYEKMTYYIEFNKDTSNFVYPEFSEHKDISLINNESVKIKPCNIGEDFTLEKINDQYIKAGSTISRTDFENAISDKITKNNKIENWYLDREFKVPAFVDDKLTVSKTGNVMELYAKYVSLPKITFELNGGTMESFEYKFIKLEDNISKNGYPYKKGYLFGGFYSDAKFENEIGVESVYLEKECTLYAKYTKLYIAEFDTKGGKLVGNELVEEGNTLINLPESVEKSGYVFKGWKLVGGDDTILTKTCQITSGVSSNIKFEAVYDEGLIINIHNLGYSNSSNPIQKITQTITIPKSCPEGYSFSELYKSLTEMYERFYLNYFSGIFIDETLTKPFVAWPSSNTDIYFAQREQSSDQQQYTLIFDLGINEVGGKSLENFKGEWINITDDNNLGNSKYSEYLDYEVDENGHFLIKIKNIPEIYAKLVGGFDDESKDYVVKLLGKIMNESPNGEKYEISDVFVDPGKTTPAKGNFNHSNSLSKLFNEDGTLANNIRLYVSGNIVSL